MKAKILLLFVAMLMASSVNSQTTLQGNIYHVKPLINVNDSTAVKPMFRRSNDGREVTMSWNYLSSLFGGSGVTPPIQDVLEAGSTGYIGDATISLNRTVTGGHNEMTLNATAVKLRTPKRGYIADDGEAGGQSYLFNENVKFYVPKFKTVNDTIAMLNDVKKNAPKDLPENFFLSTNGNNIYNYPTVPASTIFYITDQNRLFDMASLVPMPIYFTNEIVRYGNDIWVAGNNNISPVPNLIIHLKDCKIVNNILTVGSVSYKEIDLGVTLHGYKYHRGFIYFSTRPSNIAVPTKIYKVNAYNMEDVKAITLPITDEYLGNATDIYPYENYLYLVFRKVVDQPAYVVRVSQDLNSYEPVFSYGTTTTARAYTSAPTVIYNDEIYLLTQDRTSGPTTTNTIGLSVYSLTGELKRSITGQSIGANTAVPTPHWMSVFNGKLIAHTATGTGTQTRKLLRFDCYSLTLEETYDFGSTLITDDNTILPDGWVYLSQEGNNSGNLFRTKYNDFTTMEVVKSNYRSSGSVQNDVDHKSLKTKLSDFKNDLSGSGTVTSVSIVTANGISGSVATPTTTPAITLSLGAITPTSIGSATTVTTQSANDNSTKIASTAYTDAKVADFINDGATTIAPSQNVVFDNLVLKAPINNASHTGTFTLPNGSLVITSGSSTDVILGTGAATPAGSLVRAQTINGDTSTGAVLATNTVIPRAIWELNRGISSMTAYSAKTANYTITATDYCIDLTANSATLTLPTAVGVSGKQYVIKNSGLATILTLATTSSQTIDGTTTKTFNTQYSGCRVISDGANWKIIGTY